jgi:hypothetical protein
MASVYNFTFDNLTGLNDDSCSISEREMQNQNFGNYNVQSYFLQNCGMTKPIAFATSQPNVFYNGSHMIGLGGCNVDSDSNLKIGSIQTNPKCRISLQQRPFLTVPFLGRGPSRPIEESQLQQGAYSGDKKSCKNLTEKTLVTPQELVPSLKSSIQNPANLCEGIAADGWIRGGLPSRELSRDQDYFSKCN